MTLICMGKNVTFWMPTRQHPGRAGVCVCVCDCVCVCVCVCVCALVCAVIEPILFWVLAISEAMPSHSRPYGWLHVVHSFAIALIVATTLPAQHDEGLGSKTNLGPSFSHPLLADKLPSLQIQCGVNFFIMDSRRALVPPPKVLGRCWEGAGTKAHLKVTFCAI